jgi:hypothetical protein
MITSPSRNELATTFVHLRKAYVPLKVVNVSTAPTAGVIQEMKDLQPEEIFDRRYAVDVYKLRSMKPSPRAIVECSIDREKFLRIGVSMGMRAMRAVFCDACWGRGSSCRGVLTSWGPFKAALHAFVAEERALEGLGA